MALSYDKNDNIEVVVIKDVPEFHYELTINNDKEKTKVVKEIERIVRSSMEYGDYIMFLRQNVGMDACAFFNNVSKQTNKRVKIEIHHTPLTLYDISKVVLDKHLKSGEPLNTLDIAEEVMRIHYNNQVGLIPLSKTLHEVVHGPGADKVVIPIYMIFGDYMAFLEEYKDAWEDNPVIEMKIKELIEKTKELKADSYDALETKFTYLKIDGFEIPARIEDSENALEELQKAS